ncbi:SIMPL domain-containing protein [uncultured Shimia sp.]|uniref:SIMPL domain-containing protein n=1 Tax=uncultured Shimia sp. TaxID=573152 RepID=UPI00261D09F1|nr:SIMPL domain-containing protein [uncultured Shimia sp.]
MRFFWVFMALWAVALPVQAGSGQIVVTGQGTVDSVPDLAVITLGVSHQREAAGDAVKEVAVTSGAILNALKEMGVEGRDMQTSNLSLSPVWDNRTSGQAPKVAGYEARNQVTVRVRDLAVLGEILGQVTASGANRFQGLQFALQNPRPALDEARRRAVADGLSRAELYAEAAGVRLGPLVEIRDGFEAGPHPMPMMREAMASDMAMPVAEGDLSLSATVTMTYEIAE